MQDKPTIDTLPAESDLPLSRCWNYAVVDSIRFANPEPQLYQWCKTPEYHNLYRGTEWAALSDVSPLLIRLDQTPDLHDALWQHGSGTEWGYLVRSDAPLIALADHLRRFISVQHPSGQTVMLRFSDPATARILLTEPGFGFQGPMAASLLPDTLNAHWTHFQTLDTDTPTPGKRIAHPPVNLTDSLLTKLATVDHRQALQRMTQHLERYFPNRMTGASRSDVVTSLDVFLNKAIGHDFTSVSALTHWCTVFGYQGDITAKPGEFPRLYELLTSAGNTDREATARQAALIARAQTTPTETQGVS